MADTRRMKNAREYLSDYPVAVEFPMHWGEMDAFQHLNNVVYFRYFETVRIEYFRRMGLEVDSQTSVGPILGSTSCRFKVPLAYPDDLAAGARVSEVGEDRFTMEYAVASSARGCIAAVGTGVVVSYDYTAARKAGLPAAWRAAIEAIQNG